MFDIFVDLLSHFDLFIHFFSFIGLLLCILVFMLFCVYACLFCVFLVLFVFKVRDGERPQSWVSGEDLGGTGDGENKIKYLYDFFHKKKTFELK